MIVLISIIWFYAACFDEQESKSEPVSKPLKNPTKAQMLQEYDQYEARFLQDIEQIKEITHLFSNACTKSVGHWMHPKMRWDATGNIKAEKMIAKWQKNKGQEPLPNIDSYFRKNGKNKKNWLEDLDSYPSTEDWKWVDEIAQQYDCWDIDEDSPRSLLQWQEPTDVAIPNWVGLQSWIKYRLVVALQIKDQEEMVQALSSTRAWAKIMYTTENLLGEMIAVAILKIEREAYEESKRRGIDVDWEPITEQQEKILRRVLFASVNYFALWTPKEKQAIANEIPIGMCAGLNDGMTLSWFTLGYLATFKESELNHIRDWSTQCRLQWMKQKWKERTKIPPRKMQKILCTYLKQEKICSEKTNGVTDNIVEALEAALHIPPRAFWNYYRKNNEQ